MNFKSVEAFKKKNNISKKGNFGTKFLNFILLTIILILGLMIVLKIDKNNDQVIYKYLYEHNINFTAIKKYVKDILPFNTSKEVQAVFNEKLSYTNLEGYKDGASLKVSDNYLVPALQSGVVVFIGEKENYGQVLVIQQVDGVDAWYGNLNEIKVSLYDYVETGEQVASAKDKKLYLVFKKGQEVIDYKKYLE